MPESKRIREADALILELLKLLCKPSKSKAEVPPEKAFLYINRENPPSRELVLRVIASVKRA